MIEYTGKSLENFIKNSITYTFEKKRYCFNKLSEYLTNDDRRVMGIFGLKRTGKTTLMDQAIASIDDYENVLRIRCESDDSMNDIKEVIKNHSSCKYIFIDEVTYAEGFIKQANYFYDDVTYLGKKVVISGTDSLGLLLTRGDSLQGKETSIPTTYIPYKEWEYVFGKDVESYLKYGGTMTDGKVFYNENEDTLSYTNSAIAINVSRSITKWENGRNYIASRYSSLEIEDIIRRQVELSNRTFFSKVVNDTFVSHDLGSLIDLAGQRGINFIEQKNIEEFTGIIKNYLHITDDKVSIADSKTMRYLTEYLEKMNVILVKKDILNCEEDEFIFTQPGLRYSQVQDFLEALEDTLAIKYKIKVDDLNLLCKIAKEDIEGKLLEDILYTHFHYDEEYKNYQIDKYRNALGQEIDIVVIDKKTRNALAIEVKHSESANEYQAKHLNNKTLIDEVENEFNIKIVNKIVAYMGETKNKQWCDYVSIHDILTNNFGLAKRISNNN